MVRARALKNNGSSGASKDKLGGKKLVLNQGAVLEIERGHPWVWRGSISRESLDDLQKMAAGDEAALVTQDRHVVARGLVDPDSPISVRVWTTEDVAIDETLIAARVEKAVALRARIAATDTNAYRLVHGEGDRAPGVVVDRYADVAVLRLDGDAVRARKDSITRAIEPILKGLGITTLLQRGRADETVMLFGELPKGPIRVREHGVPFVADVVRGQKTGAFLDQRENRRRVGAMAREKTVLNLFSYAGGFSLHAAVGGAKKVTSVDIAGAAHVTAQESFKAAGIDPRAHEFVTADAFAFLENAKRQGKSWDLIVSDPPSFAPNEKSKERALGAYRSLHKACAAVLAPGGTFCAASCSSHVDARAFLSTLDDAALGRHDLRLIALYGPPEDHPTLAAFPEGQYLKFAELA